MAPSSAANWFERKKLADAADWLAVAFAVSLPWSTSATGILAVLWAIALIPSLEWEKVRSEVTSAVGGLPVLLFALGLLGMAWADVSLHGRFGGLDSFVKLLAIPLLFAQFGRSERGVWIFGGYLASCAVLLAASTVVGLLPANAFIHLTWDKVLVKNSATQGGEFVTCIFGLLYFAADLGDRERRAVAAGALLLALAFLANVLYVATSRTALVTIVPLLLVLAVRRLSAKGAILLFCGVVLIGAVAWSSSPYLRFRTTSVWTEIGKYETNEGVTSSGERLEFYRKSLRFVADAPVFGHGTGSIPELFRRSAVGQTGAAASATTNPHNQTFAVAIQLGLVGAVVLWAMWIAHLLLFRGPGLAEWIGAVIVVQNVVGSLFNSHLFDFVQGWVYVIGVGVAGGMVLKGRLTKPPGVP